MWSWNIPGVFVACQPFSNMMSRLKVRPERGGPGGGGGVCGGGGGWPRAAKFASAPLAYLKELFICNLTWTRCFTRVGSSIVLLRARTLSADPNVPAVLVCVAGLRRCGGPAPAPGGSVPVSWVVCCSSSQLRSLLRLLLSESSVLVL